MKRREYRKIYDSLNLTEEQQKIILSVLEDLGNQALKTQFKLEKLGRKDRWWEGKVEGLNIAAWFFSGEMDCRDEFEEEDNERP